MVEQSLPPVDNSNCPLPKKKHVQYQRFQRKLKGMMKNKRTRKRLTRIFAPYIHELVQEELKRQSLPSVPRISAD
ncbi:hypothetical protein AAC387_Pa09g0291 [Persea americana]